MFRLANWGKASTTSNEPLTTLQNNFIQGCFRTYTYFAQEAPDGDGDTQATIAAPGYFNAINYDLETGDVIWAESAEDQTVVSYLVNNADGVITVSSFNFDAESIGTANIVNGAVTYPKIQDVAASSLLGNPTGAGATVSEIGLGNGLEFSGATLRVRPQYAGYQTGTLTAAQWNGMYAAPQLLLPNPGPNLMIVVQELLLNFHFGTTRFAAGGAVIGQYGNTINGGGVNALSGTIAAATVNAVNANNVIAVNNLTGPTLTATTVNSGVYLSNQTAAFTTGDSTITWHCWYKVIAAT